MRVVILAGGRSSEHEISLASGSAVLDGLEQAGYDVESVVIGRDGVWRQQDPRDSDGAGGPPVALVPGGGGAALLRIEDDGEEPADVDVVFPVLHGPFGEDGTVQGLLECADLPYVGAGVLASALCMDKGVFKTLMAAAGVPQVEHEVVTETRWNEKDDRVRECVAKLGMPVFVKPARLGSSLGISKATSAAELGRSLRAAFEHDPRVVVEREATGKEVECSVIGNQAPIASQPGQIVAHADWYDYEAKYGEGGMDLIVPAPLSPQTIERVRELAVDVFRLAGCAGLARVDFFVPDSGDVLVNEINTIPGFTSTSVFARLFEASGVPYAELLQRLVELALERHQVEQQYRF